MVVVEEEKFEQKTVNEVEAESYLTTARRGVGV